MLTITCLTENSAQRGSQYWGEHGLAFLIETDQGRVLFDTGQTDTVLLHNLGILKRSLHEIDAVALSHAHNDHTGGLPTVLARRPGLPVYANPDIGRPRYSMRDERYRYIGLPLPMDALAQMADLRLSAEPAQILPGVWTTGEIRERPDVDGSSPRHKVPGSDGWQADQYLDDLSLVLETPSGLVLLCGCCHAGLLNTLAHVRRMFSGEIIAVVGGTHLESVAGSVLEHVVTQLRGYGSLRYYLNHCSGERAFVALTQAFGERQVQPFPAGMTVTA
jgi:7,8-dihydropterin-6-yl-methyl-4-(beta-D-ribofuranosyl)aminobenzene 5'-phosphate synthase